MSKNQKGSAQQDNHGVKQKLKKNCLESTVKEGVSYKDALLTETLSIKVEEAQRGDVRSPCPPNSYGPKPIPCSIPSSAQLWLKDWFYAIIHFLEEEQKQILWDLPSLLQSWFSDIDSLENFRSLKKLKMWAIIERLPLSACHVPIITDIAGKWGEVIKVDEETTNRGRLDKARVLVRVSDLSDISPYVSLILNGSYVLIKVLTDAFEDDRRWIDQDSTGVSDECLQSCRFEDYGHALNEVAADSFPDAKDLKEAIIRPHDPDVARANLFQYNTENEGGRWL
ncbi:hypothetical protein V6N11_022731 [Hibiscus sabdariffa]|uniref:Uncharacterized protein n=1 Tax=Hibiscus sabdariffa TaxID=183260 RepID=A0ABR2TKF8_9ROSI